jgi:hypothetical protein
MADTTGKKVLIKKALYSLTPFQYQVLLSFEERVHYSLQQICERYSKLHSPSLVAQMEKYIFFKQGNTEADVIELVRKLLVRMCVTETSSGPRIVTFIIRDNVWEK